MTGTVEQLTLRVTKLRTGHGEFVVVPNSALRQVTNLSKDWSRVVLDIPIPATEDLDRATAVLREAADSLADDDAWSACCWATRWWPAWRRSRSATCACASSCARCPAASST